MIPLVLYIFNQQSSSKENKTKNIKMNNDIQQQHTPVDDLSFLVACKIAELSMAENNPTQQLTTEHFVKTLQNLAMSLHVPWEHIQQRLAWEHVRQYCSGVNVPSTRQHIYLLIKRHCPDELSHLPERLGGLSATQLLDVLVLLDEAFGGSAQASSCVGDGFREVLLRNSVLERENAELTMQLRSIHDKPKAQQNEAAFLVADLQQKLYEALGTMQSMMSTISISSKKEPRNFGCQVSSSSSNSTIFVNTQQQPTVSSSPTTASSSPTVSQQQSKTSSDHYIKQIKELEKKLEESLKREVSTKEEMLSRISQYSALANSLITSVKNENNNMNGTEYDNPLQGCKHISVQTEPDMNVLRLQRERKLLLERLAAATELLKKSTTNTTTNQQQQRRLL